MWQRQSESTDFRGKENLPNEDGNGEPAAPVAVAA